MIRAILLIAAKDLLLPAALWFAWLLLGLVWAPDKPAAFTYLAIVVTMAAVLLATAAAGGTRRRLIWFGYSMILVYAFVVGFTGSGPAQGVRTASRLPHTTASGPLIWQVGRPLGLGTRRMTSWAIQRCLAASA